MDVKGEKAKEEYFDFLRNVKVRGNSSEEDKRNVYTKLFGLMNAFKPSTLYRFRAGNPNDIDALLSGRVYFNRPMNFNDPHDCLMYVNPDVMNTIKSAFDIKKIADVLQDVKDNGADKYASPNYLGVVNAINRLRNESNMFQSDSAFDFLLDNEDSLHRLNQMVLPIIEKQHNENLRLAREDIYIACFSDSVASSTMWAHYADYHRGFALAYDTSELSFLSQDCVHCQNTCEHRHITNLYPVEYSNNRYDATEYESETFKFLLSNFFEQGNAFITPDILHEIKLYTAKGMDWKYEGEWRLIFNRGSKPQVDYVAYEKLHPKAIFFGSEMPESQKETISNSLCREEADEIMIYEMFVDRGIPQYRISCKERKRNPTYAFN